jgi:hypothetical protein
MEAADVRLEFGLQGGAFASPAFDEDAFGGSEWIDVTGECRASVPITLEYGIFSDAPDALVSGAGTLSFALDNSENNAAGIRGWYSPLNAIKRGGFEFNIPVRLILSNGVTTIYKFLGRLSNINVVPDVHDSRIVHCTALDLMDDYGRLLVPALATQFDKRGDELVQTILDALPSELQPNQRSIETSLDTHEIALDTASEEAVTIREAIYEICASELSTAYFIGTSASGGGLFSFANRQASILNPVVFRTFEDEIDSRGLDVPGSRDDLVSKVQVTVHPTRIATSNEILYDLQTTSTLIAAGTTYDYLFGPYRDPANPGDRVGGTDMIQPVATTDYTMNTLQDGSGADLTSDFTVTASYTSSGVRFTITNHGAVDGYVTKLQARGLGVYRYTAVIERDVPDVPYGHQVMQLDMPYQNNVNTGTDVADYLANVESQLLTRAKSVRFFANATTTTLSAMLAIEPGIRIAITEEMTGLDAAEFIVSGVRLEIENAGISPIIWTTLYTRTADSTRYWSLGTAGASELGETTTLGY